MTEAEDPWTTDDAARYYAVTPRVVVGWVKAGKLPVLRRRPHAKGRGAYLFARADVVALEHQGERVNVDDVAAIIDAEMRQRKRGRKPA